jgi:trk system potassium uptake protein TrkA
MYIMIIGGGKVGYYLAKTLGPDKHKIVLIEEDMDMCLKVVNELSELGIKVIHGDGTDIEYLRDAEIEKADIFIAVTGGDENNLVACQLAKQYFAVPRTIARVNNPKNINVFKQLGVDSVVSSTALIADIIELEVDYACINNLLSLNVGNIRIKELDVMQHSLAANKKISDLKMPEGAIIISIIRGQNVIVPDGQTVMKPDDHVIALANSDRFERLSAVFG